MHLSTSVPETSDQDHNPAESSAVFSGREAGHFQPANWLPPIIKGHNAI